MFIHMYTTKWKASELFFFGITGYVNSRGGILEEEKTWGVQGLNYTSRL